MSLTEASAPLPAARTRDVHKNHEDALRRGRSWHNNIPSTSRDDANFLSEVTKPSPAHNQQNRRNVDVEAQSSSKPDIHQNKDRDTFESRTQLRTNLISASWIIFFSFLGTLARLGVEAISIHPYAPFTSPVVWANFGGSLFMGFLLEDRRLFRDIAPSHLLHEPKDHGKMREKEETFKEQLHSQIDKHKKLLPLYIGLTTGFCGSFTSFSTFVTDAFLALTNALPVPSPTSPYHNIDQSEMQPRNGGYSFMACVATLIIDPAVSISALKTGMHLAAGLESYLPSVPKKFIYKVLDTIIIFLGPACWLGAVFLTAFPPELFWRKRVTFALVLSPIGALLRWYLSKALNSRNPSFPLGTFAANMIGTLIAGMAFDLQHAASIVGSDSLSSAALINTCGAFAGVIQGFCGCLTTVSTWVAELNGLRTSHAWMYGFVSVAVGLGLHVIIMGSLGWTEGFDSSCS